MCIIIIYINPCQNAIKSHGNVLSTFEQLTDLHSFIFLGTQTEIIIIGTTVPGFIVILLLVIIILLIILKCRRNQINSRYLCNEFMTSCSKINYFCF